MAINKFFSRNLPEYVIHSIAQGIYDFCMSFMFLHLFLTKFFYTPRPAVPKTCTKVFNFTHIFLLFIMIEHYLILIDCLLFISVLFFMHEQRMSLKICCYENSKQKVNWNKSSYIITYHFSMSLIYCLFSREQFLNMTFETIYWM